MPADGGGGGGGALGLNETAFWKREGGTEGGGSLRICQKGGIRIVGGKGGEARRPRRFEKRTGRNFSHFLQRVLFACHEWPICFPMQIAKSPSILLKCYSLFFAENISH